MQKVSNLILASKENSFIIDGSEKYDENGNIVTQEDILKEEKNTQIKVESKPEQQQSFFSNPIVGIVYIAVFAGLFIYMSSSNKKRENKIKQMQDSIKSGDDVVTSNGFYGKIVDISEENFVVEFGINKGIRIPVRKRDIFLVKSDLDTTNVKN